jgi:hypothetical protein
MQSPYSGMCQKVFFMQSPYSGVVKNGFLCSRHTAVGKKHFFMQSPYSGYAKMHFLCSRHTAKATFIHFSYCRHISESHFYTFFILSPISERHIYAFFILSPISESSHLHIFVSSRQLAKACFTHFCYYSCLLLFLQIERVTQSHPLNTEFKKLKLETSLIPQVYLMKHEGGDSKLKTRNSKLISTFSSSSALFHHHFSHC